MANRDNPMGFRPAQGIGSQHVLKLFRVDATGNATYDLGVGDVADLDGYGVNAASADAGVSAAGIVVAVYDKYKCICGAPGSLVTTQYLTKATDGWALVALAIPGAVFICQDDGSAALDEDSIGLTSDHKGASTNPVNTTTGKSTHELNATTGGLQFRIIGLVDEPGNAWGVNADLYVVFNESAFGASAAASV